MQTYQVTFTQAVNIADIEAALSLVGAFKLTAARQPKPKTEKVFQEPLTVWREGAEVRELNPVEIDKAIRKMDSARAAELRHDGRQKGDFPQFVDVRDTIERYVQSFCSRLNHKATTYFMGAETVAA